VSVHTAQLEPETFPQDPRLEALIRYLKRSFPDAHDHWVYEAGF
jgi:hypothetical protein